LAFATGLGASGGTERMRITSAGNVNIGSASSAIQATGLHVAQGAPSILGHVAIECSTNATTGPTLHFAKSRGSVGSKSAISTAGGDILGSIIFTGYDGSTERYGAEIQAISVATSSTGTDMPADLAFFTTPDGTASVVERMRIDDAGNVSIGIASGDGKLHVWSATAGSISADADHDELVLENSGMCGMTILSGASSHGTIAFGDDGDANDGILGYDQGDRAMYIKVAGDNTKRFKIDADSRISLSNNDSGTSNTVFGKLAGDDLESGGDYNTFLGENAGHENQLGDSNIAIGTGAFDASYINDTQDALTVDNVFIGNNAGGGIWVTAASHSNVGVGKSVMDAVMNGALYNTAVGHSALGGLTSGDYNTAVGANALNAITGGTGNVGVGQSALSLTQDGNSNVAIGSYDGTTVAAMRANVSASQCVGIGTGALGGVTTQDGSIAVGYKSLTALTSGAGNTAMGYNAGAALTTGERNTILGYGALDAASTEADDNVAIGYDALGGGIGTGAVIKCVAIGNYAMDAAVGVGASGSVAIGYSALGAIESGEFNTAVGFESLKTENQGDKNTAIGYQALTTQDTASNVGENTAVGYQSGDVITTGVQNTIIGAGSDPSANSGTNQTVVGYATTGVADNSVTLGNASVTAVYMAEDSGATVHCAKVKSGASDNLRLQSANGVLIDIDNDANATNEYFQVSKDNEATMLFKVVESGTISIAGGINFPDTQVADADANTLDDYEEGDHTATIVGSTSGNFVVNSTNDILRYTKIGRLVNIQGLIVIDSDNSTSGTFRISLPFTIGDGTGLGGRSYAGVSLDSHGGTIAGRVYAKLVEGDAFFILVQVADDGTPTDLNESHVDGAFNIGVNFSYTV